jgi:hypothetical protein
VVCDQHGGAAPQVRRRAVERLIMTADRAAENLVRMMEDTEVPFGVRAKIAQDLLDRAGVIATQVHQIIPTTEDPIMRFFEGVFSDPRNWEENPPRPAIEEPVIDSDVEPEEIAEAQIVEPEGEPANDTPPRIAGMIKRGADPQDRLNQGIRVSPQRHSCRIRKSCRYRKPHACCGLTLISAEQINHTLAIRSDGCARDAIDNFPPDQNRM